MRGRGRGMGRGKERGPHVMFGLLELSTDSICLQFPNFVFHVFHPVLIAGPTMDSQSLSKTLIYLRLRSFHNSSSTTNFPVSFGN